MFKVIIVASGKGGTGKTSFCAGVGTALAQAANKVLIIDGDSKLRNLDLVLGMSDRVVFSFEDVARGLVTLEKAAVQYAKDLELYVLTAPYNLLHEDVKKSDIENLLEQAYVLGFDYVLLDCPAGITREFSLFNEFATQGVVVSTPDAACLRGAEAMAREMEENGLVRIRLVVNRVRPNLIKDGHAANIDRAMDLTGLALLGIIPEDEDVIVSGNNGKPIVAMKHTGAARAYLNIASRIEGNKVPIMKINKNTAK